MESHPALEKLIGLGELSDLCNEDVLQTLINDLTTLKAMDGDDDDDDEKEKWMREMKDHIVQLVMMRKILLPLIKLNKFPAVLKQVSRQPLKTGSIYSLSRINTLLLY